MGIHRMAKEEEILNHTTIQDTDPAIQAASTHDKTGKPPAVAGSVSDTKMSTIIGWVLQGGVMLSSLIIVIGFILLLLTPQALSTRLHTFPHSLPGLWSALMAGNPLAVIVIG